MLFFIRPKTRAGGVEVRKPWAGGRQKSNAKRDKKKREEGKKQRKRGKGNRKKNETFKKVLVSSPETPPTQLKKARFQDDTKVPKEHQSNCEKGEGWIGKFIKQAPNTSKETDNRKTWTNDCQFTSERGWHQNTFENSATTAGNQKYEFISEFKNRGFGVGQDRNQRRRGREKKSNQNDLGWWRLNWPDWEGDTEKIRTTQTRESMKLISEIERNHIRRRISCQNQCPLVVQTTSAGCETNLNVTFNWNFPKGGLSRKIESFRKLGFPSGLK